MLSLGLKITMGVIMAIQLLAIGYAAHLMRRTKYSVIWILCIACFITSFVQHFIYIFSTEPVDFELFIAFDLVLSVCLALAILFANKLVNYIDHLNYQREHLSKQLLSTVMRTEEHSRSQFAKELHDGMGPLLSSAKMSLSAISSENMSEQQKEILQNTRFVIDEAIRSVREISNNMSPQILIDFGLSQGIRNFISRIKSLHTINIAFETELHEERFDNDTEVVLYRVVCELINNSLKHSGCSAIDIFLLREENSLVLKYRDNGCGFTFDTQTISKGMGLSNIASRIKSLNGSLAISSSDGGGMSAIATIDIKAEEPSSTVKKQQWKRR